MKARILSPAEFTALRARIQKKPAPLRPAKARITINRPGARMASVIIVPKKDAHADAHHTFKPVPGRVMALDLSMAKTGLAWGRPGEKPEATVCIMGNPSMHPGETEGDRIASMAQAIAWHCASRQACLVVFSEFYSAKNMLSFRANVSLRGAVMAELSCYGLDAVPIPEITARKAAGVDIRKRRADEAKGYMKERAHARLAELGLGYLQEDEGDAAILLMGCWVPLGLPAPSSFKDRPLTQEA